MCDNQNKRETKVYREKEQLNGEDPWIEAKPIYTLFTAMGGKDD